VRKIRRRPNTTAFRGLIDELRLFNQSSIYGGRLPASHDRVRRRRDTAALYHFDETSGTDIVDASNADASPGRSDSRAKRRCKSSFHPILRSDMSATDTAARVKSLAHIAIKTIDLDTTIAFYQQVLDMQLVPRPPLIFPARGWASMATL